MAADAIAAVTEAHPMEWMQPCVEHGEADHEGDRIGANDAGLGPLAEPPFWVVQHDGELESVDEGENRAEGEIGDHHRAQRAANAIGFDPDAHAKAKAMTNSATVKTEFPFSRVGRRFALWPRSPRRQAASCAAAELMPTGKRLRKR